MLKTKQSRQFTFIGVLVCVLLGIWSSLSAQGQSPKSLSPETTQLLSPHCDESQLRALGADALLGIDAPHEIDAPPTFTVTLDPQKMSFTDFTKKMQHAGCI